MDQKANLLFTTLLKKFKTSEFNRNVVKVFSGTFLAQLITIGISPVLTRIYSPQDFSNLALYLSVVSIITVITTLKYDKAIILPEDDKKALSLVVIATFSSLVVGALFFSFYFFSKSFIISLFKVDGIESWLVFVPITIIARSLYTIINTWFNRNIWSKRVGEHSFKQSRDCQLFDLWAPRYFISPCVFQFTPSYAFNFVGLGNGSTGAFSACSTSCSNTICQISFD